MAVDNFTQFSSVEKIIEEASRLGLVGTEGKAETQLVISNFDDLLNVYEKAFAFVRTKIKMQKSTTTKQLTPPTPNSNRQIKKEKKLKAFKRQRKKSKMEETAIALKDQA